MAEDKMTFAAIVLVAIVAIVGMIGFMGTGFTGFSSASREGTLNINFAGTADIVLTRATCDFGSGYVNASGSSATLNCNGTKSGWINTTAFAPNEMTLENNGSTLVNITIKSNATATTFIGPSATAKYVGSTNESSSCSGTLTSSLTELTTSDQMICTQLEYLDANDNFNINYQLSIPATNITQGAKTAKITFTGTSL